MIPSPLRFVCWLRSLLRSTWVGRPVDGCDYVESPPELGQPCCVYVLHCSLCGRLSVGWEDCVRCGYRPKDPSDDKLIAAHESRRKPFEESNG